MSPILECRDLHIAYDQEPTISGVNFTLLPGKCFALVGASGSGKSTIARAVLGLHRPQTRLSGMLKFAGRNLLMIPEQDWCALRGGQIGYVAQDPYSACDPLRTVGHHVAQPWRSHKRKLPQDAVWNRLANVGIDAPQHRAKQAPHCWSGGMLQRACIAAATAHTPPLIVADEPTSALDAARADDILKTLKESGSAILLISHDIDLVRRHADKIAILHKGKLVDSFAVSEIDDLTRHKATRMLVRAGSATPQRTPQTQGKLIVGAKAITRKYAKSERTVGSVSFDVHAGCCVGLSGPSGSGKSTVLRMLAGIEAPDEGHINYSLALDRPGAIMPVFQNPAASLNPYWPIWRTVSEPATVRCRLSKFNRRAIARHHLRDVGLYDVDIDARPSAFSLGQCQRIAIARAVAAEPMLLIADEPTSALDTISRAQVADLLDTLVMNGMALVLASHDPWMHARLTTQRVQIA